jgi:hypothetical protein
VDREGVQARYETVSVGERLGPIEYELTQEAVAEFIESYRRRRRSEATIFESRSR